jgi:hypothetical protein
LAGCHMRCLTLTEASRSACSNSRPASRQQDPKEEIYGGKYVASCQWQAFDRIGTIWRDVWPYLFDLLRIFWSCQGRGREFESRFPLQNFPCSSPGRVATPTCSEIAAPRSEQPCGRASPCVDSLEMPHLGRRSTSSVQDPALTDGYARVKRLPAARHARTFVFSHLLDYQHCVCPAECKRIGKRDPQGNISASGSCHVI